MRPVRLELHNFLAYRAPGPINFEGLHIACLSGANGAGKSSLLDAITWALWGKARGSANDQLIHIGQDEMQVRLEFEQDHARYRVERKLVRKGKSSKSELALYAWDDGLWNPHSAAVRETQSAINDLLRLDYETFVNSAFLQQGKADSFSVMTPSKRKDLLADILGLVRWQNYEERARGKIREYDETLRVIDLRLRDIAEEEAQEPQRRTEAETWRAKFDAIKAQLHDEETALETLRGEAAALESRRERRKESAQAHEEVENELKRLEVDGKDQRQKLDKYKAVIEAGPHIRESYAQLTALRQMDTELGKRRNRHDELEAELNPLLRQWDRLRTELEADLKNRQRAVDEVAREADTLREVSRELDALRADLAVLDQRKAERDSLHAQQGQLSEQKAAFTQHNVTLRAEMADLKSRQHVLDTAREALCPACGQPLDEAHRADLIHQYETEGKGYADTYRANERQIGQLEKDLKTYSTQFRNVEREIEQLEQRRTREGQLDERRQKAQQAAERLAHERTALDEARQKLNDEDFGRDLRPEIDSLQAAIAHNGYDRASHAEIQQTLESLAEYEVRFRELETAQAAVDGLEAQIEQTRVRYKQGRERSTGIQRQTTEIDLEIESLEKKANAERVQREKVKRLRADADKTQSDLLHAEQLLAAIETNRRRKDELTAQQSTLRTEQGYFSELQEAFGRNGVPAMVIEAAIPELEVLANELLGRMTDGRMHIRFDTTRARKSDGGVIETLDLQISDELGTRAYEMFSGGEGFRVNFALRVALSQFLARRAGARLQTLVIDEGFGSQDTAGRERLVEAINAIRDDFDLILIVTHIEDLRDSFPAQIEVRKTAEGSKVTLR